MNEIKYRKSFMIIKIKLKSLLFVLSKELFQRKKKKQYIDKVVRKIVKSGEYIVTLISDYLT